MNDTKRLTTGPDEPNLVTKAAHRREVLWQITMPLLLGVVLFLGLIALTIVGGVQGDPMIGKWADTSLIWLILPALMFTLVFILITGGLVYLLLRLINILPGYSHKLQRIFWRIQEVVEKGADTAASPVIKAAGFRAAWRALLGKPTK